MYIINNFVLFIIIIIILFFMILPLGFEGKVEAKIIKLYSDSYNLVQVSEKLNKLISIEFNAIVSTNSNLSGDKFTYISNEKINLTLVYDKLSDLYESYDDNLNFIYLVKIDKII